MAFNLVEYTVSLPADEDLSTSQYKFVCQDATSGNVRMPTGASEYALGIQNNVPSATVNAGDGLYQIQPTVVVSGITRIRVDNIYAVGTFLMPQYSATADYNGRGTDAAGTPKYARAILLQASTAVDDIVTCRLIDQNPGSGAAGATGVVGPQGVTGIQGMTGVAP